MRSFLALRSIVRAARDWWRSLHHVPRFEARTPEDTMKIFDYNVAARIAFDSNRMASMQDSASNTKPVKPIGRVV